MVHVEELLPEYSRRVLAKKDPVRVFSCTRHFRCDAPVERGERQTFFFHA